MDSSITMPWRDALFAWIVIRPWRVLAAALGAIVLFVLALTQLERDPSVDAFIPKDHPSYVTAERARDVFGLADPIVVALSFDARGGVFQPQNLELLRKFHEAALLLDNVRYGGVTSLASESFVVPAKGTADIRPYLPSGDVHAADALQARRGWRAMAAHQGTLVSADENSAGVLLELVDNKQADVTYQQVLDLASRFEAPDLPVHVAGLGAVVGFLSETISRDVRALVPYVYGVVLCVIFVAFRSWRALVVPLPVIVGAAAGSLGLMSVLGIPYFAITSALPVVVVAIAVADTIYILSAYREAMTTVRMREAAVVVAMSEVSIPITLTSVTTALGFLAIASVSIMPPIMHFAWLAAVGILLAWAFSLLVVPAMIVLLRFDLAPRGSRLSKLVTSALQRLSTLTVARPITVVLLFALLIAAALSQALQLRVDRSLVSSFPVSSSIRQADEFVNSEFAGTAFLDVWIDTGEVDGALRPELLQRVVAMQTYMETLPRINTTVSIADYLSPIHRAMSDVPVAPRELPESDEALAQYLFLYEASAQPDALREEIDADAQRLLVRGILDSRYSSQEVAAVEALQAYVAQHFGDANATVELSGRVNTRYHWMARLGFSHLLGVGLSLACVTMMIGLLFRSALSAVVAITPVAASVLVLYAVMRVSGAHLEPATSMFAAISIGLGADYAIHFLHRLQREHESVALVEAAARTAEHTGRACFFNALAIGAGLGVLLTSDLGTLKNFGLLIATASTMSFFAAFILIPALHALRSQARLGRSVGVLASLMLAVLVVSPDVQAQTPVPAVASADEIAARIDARNDGRYIKRSLKLTLISPRGTERVREAVTLRDLGDVRRALIVFEGPKAIRETAFLNHNYPGARSDQRWLYLPAAGRARRLPASERGSAFMGSDFTYADVQSELKFDPADYTFDLLEPPDAAHVHLTGQTKDQRTARELGYTRFEALVPLATLIPSRIRFFDAAERLTRVIEVTATGEADGVIYAQRIVARNERSGHQSIFEYDAVSFPQSIDTAMFDARRLQRGLLRSMP